MWLLSICKHLQNKLCFYDSNCSVHLCFSYSLVNSSRPDWHASNRIRPVLHGNIWIWGLFTSFKNLYLRWKKYWCLSGASVPQFTSGAQHGKLVLMVAPEERLFKSKRICLWSINMLNSCYSNLHKRIHIES